MMKPIVLSSWVLIKLTVKTLGQCSKLSPIHDIIDLGYKLFHFTTNKYIPTVLLYCGSVKAWNIDFFYCSLRCHSKEQ